MKSNFHDILVRYILSAVFMLFLCGAANATDKLCNALSPILSSPVEFQSRSPRFFPDERREIVVANLPVSSKGPLTDAICIERAGSSFIPNVDVNNDGLIDTIYFECPNSGSSEKADPCLTDIQLGGGGSLRLNAYYPLLSYNGKLYAIHAEIGRDRKKGSGAAYSITASGLQLVCDKL